MAETSDVTGFQVMGLKSSTGTMHLDHCYSTARNCVVLVSELKINSSCVTITFHASFLYMMQLV